LISLTGGRLTWLPRLAGLIALLRLTWLLGAGAVLRPRLTAALFLAAMLENPLHRLAIVRPIGCDCVLRRRVARLPTATACL
jgi:hypothetical protein